jgi:hypothetical protein
MLRPLEKRDEALSSRASGATRLRWNGARGGPRLLAGRLPGLCGVPDHRSERVVAQESEESRKTPRPRVWAQVASGQVMDLFRPDLDTEAAGNNLHHTLHFARGSLEVTPSNTTRYLQGDMLALCPDGTLWVDAEAFEEAAATARRSLPGSRRALHGRASARGLLRRMDPGTSGGAAGRAGRAA